MLFRDGNCVTKPFLELTMCLGCDTYMYYFASDILRRVVNALVYHIDDCTGLPNRRLLAINICSSLVLGKPGAEYNYNTGNTYSRMANNKTVQEGVGRTGDDNGSGLSMTSIEQEFHSALLRRLDDPSNVSLCV